ncbi:hypothetical protein HUJ04_005440 [Dendroctonus ponderosae]|nr:hypothetical protein HUJ04_005440 [Dendroctonus ponderosae]
MTTALNEAAMDIGLELNLEKCGQYSGENNPDQTTFLPQIGQAYKYLGLTQLNKGTEENYNKIDNLNSAGPSGVTSNSTDNSRFDEFEDFCSSESEYIPSNESLSSDEEELLKVDKKKTFSYLNQNFTPMELCDHLSTDYVDVVNNNTDDTEISITTNKYIKKSTAREKPTLPQDIYQTAKVAKVLLLLEKGRGKEFKGKNLNEIELEKDIYYSSESEEDIAEEEQTVKKQTLTQENKTLNSETKNTSGNKEDVNRRSDQETYKNKRVPREGKKAENKASETGEDITLPSKTPKAIKAIVRWSISEKETAASEPATYKDFLGVFFLPMALKWLKTYRGEGRGIIMSQRATKILTLAQNDDQTLLFLPKYETTKGLEKAYQEKCLKIMKLKSSSLPDVYGVQEQKDLGMYLQCPNNHQEVENNHHELAVNKDKLKTDVAVNHYDIEVQKGISGLKYDFGKSEVEKWLATNISELNTEVASDNPELLEESQHKAIMTEDKIIPENEKKPNENKEINENKISILQNIQIKPERQKGEKNSETYLHVRTASQRLKTHQQGFADTYDSDEIEEPFQSSGSEYLPSDEEGNQLPFIFDPLITDIESIKSKKIPKKFNKVQDKKLDQNGRMPRKVCNPNYDCNEIPVDAVASLKDVKQNRKTSVLMTPAIHQLIIKTKISPLTHLSIK